MVSFQADFGSREYEVVLALLLGLVPVGIDILFSFLRDPLLCGVPWAQYLSPPL